MFGGGMPMQGAAPGTFNSYTPAPMSYTGAPQPTFTSAPAPAMWQPGQQLLPPQGFLPQMPTQSFLPPAAPMTLPPQQFLQGAPQQFAPQQFAPVVQAYTQPAAETTELSAPTTEVVETVQAAPVQTYAAPYAAPVMQTLPPQYVSAAPLGTQTYMSAQPISYQAQHRSYLPQVQTVQQPSYIPAAPMQQNASYIPAAPMQQVSSYIPAPATMMAQPQISPYIPQPAVVETIQPQVTYASAPVVQAAPASYIPAPVVETYQAGPAPVVSYGQPQPASYIPAPVVEPAAGQSVIVEQVGDWQVCEDEQGIFYHHVPTQQSFDNAPQEFLALFPGGYQPPPMGAFAAAGYGAPQPAGVQYVGAPATLYEPQVLAAPQYGTAPQYGAQYAVQQGVPAQYPTVMAQVLN